MKKYILILLLSFVAIPVTAQEKYIVVHVSAHVLKADSSKIVKGTTLTPDDKLIFPASGGLVILLHPKKGRLKVTPTEKDKKGNAFIVLLKDYLKLNAEWIKLSATNG